MADPATVPDQPVGGGSPLLARQERTDILLDFFRVGMRCPAEPARQPGKVGVHRQAGLAEGIAEHQIGGLAAYTREGHKLLERVRHLPAEAVTQSLSEGDELVRLGPEETGGPDEPLEFCPVCGSVI